MLPAMMKDRLGFAATRLFPQLLGLRTTAHVRARFKVRKSSARLEILDPSERRAIWLSRGNAVYVPDMMNSFDYYFGSADSFGCRIGREEYEVVDFSTPRFQRVRGFDDFPLLCPSLTEPFLTAQQYLDFASLTEGAVVLDLGCYSALTSIAFSKVVGPRGRVVALEPDPKNFRAARTNVEQHLRFSGLENITLKQAAAHSGRGVLQFSSEGAMGSASASFVGSYRGDLIEVQALGLNELAADEGLDRVDFVKMDIEGAEETVLEGARAFLRRYRPKLIIEPHVVGGRLSDDPVMAILRSEGYRCEVIVQTGVELPLVTATPAD